MIYGRNPQTGEMDEIRAGGGYIPVATQNKAGAVKPGNGLEVAADGTLSSKHKVVYQKTLTDAITYSDLLVDIGTNVTFSSDKFYVLAIQEKRYILSSYSSTSKIRLINNTISGEAYRSEWLVTGADSINATAYRMVMTSSGTQYSAINSETAGNSGATITLYEI